MLCQLPAIGPSRLSLARVTSDPFPGAVPPVRQYPVTVSGVNIAVHEWGAADAEPMFLVHGGFDFGRTFEVFAPMLAESGWRVITWDMRGHGDSDPAALYSMDADLRDMIGVMDSVTDRPAVVVGHSKGGSMAVQLADAQPYRFGHLINIDGMPWRKPMSDLSEHERTRMLQTDLADWLDHRRRAATLERKTGTPEELARRRLKLNPRLPLDWLQHLVRIGARHDDDGWRWKLDPVMRPGGFGPWRSEWSASRLPGLGMPLLAILAGQPEPLGWGTTPGQIAALMPRGGRVVHMHDAGHFIHIEQPRRVADTILEFVGGSR